MLSNRLFAVAEGKAWAILKNQWTDALGITCDEIFATVSQGNVVRIVRVRPDSLGAGTPPD